MSGRANCDICKLCSIFVFCLVGDELPDVRARACQCSIYDPYLFEVLRSRQNLYVCVCDGPLIIVPLRFAWPVVDLSILNLGSRHYR